MRRSAPSRDGRRLGRGTDRPFECYGHPDLKERGYTFTPPPDGGAKHPPLEGRLCRGVDLREMPLDEARQVGFTLRYVIDAYRDLETLGDGFFTPMFEKLVGAGWVREMIPRGGYRRRDPRPLAARGGTVPDAAGQVPLRRVGFPFLPLENLPDAVLFGDRPQHPARISAATTRGGMSCVTTLPAPITAPSPIVTPCVMTACPPIQTSLPIRTGSERMIPSARWSGSRAWFTV